VKPPLADVAVPPGDHHGGTIGDRPAGHGRAYAGRPAGNQDHP
jgi:hypothetical protein